MLRGCHLPAVEREINKYSTPENFKQVLAQPGELVVFSF
jgi:hypothetical protein